MFLFGVRANNGKTNGKLTPTGNRTTRREQANWLCQQGKPTSNADKYCDKVLAFISLSNPDDPTKPDQIKDFDVLYGIPMSNVALWGGGTSPNYTPVTIAASLGGFLSGPSLQNALLNNALDTTGLTNWPSEWLSFSKDDGSLDYDCSVPINGLLRATHGQTVSKTHPFYINTGNAGTGECVSEWLVCLCY